MDPFFLREAVQRLVSEANFTADVEQKRQVVYFYDITEDGFNYIIADAEDAVPDVVTVPHKEYIAKPHFKE